MKKDLTEISNSSPDDGEKESKNNDETIEVAYAHGIGVPADGFGNQLGWYCHPKLDW